MHAPADAARMLERTRNQLIERVHEQLALTDRREEGERGTIGWADASSTGSAMRPAASARAVSPARRIVP